MPLIRSVGLRGGGVSAAPPPVGPDDTRNYVEVTIAASQVSSTLTDFPVYVDLSDLPAAFFTNVQSDGGDIRVTEADGTTRAPVDLVSIDTGTSTGELHFLASSLSSSTDTVYRIYYNATSTLSQPGVATTYGRNAVWGDYLFVSHDGGGTNATGNGAWTEAGTLSEGAATGQIGGATVYDGSTEIVYKEPVDVTTVGGTVSAWIKLANTTQTDKYAWQYRERAADQNGILYGYVSNTFEAYGGGGTAIWDRNAITTGTIAWAHVMAWNDGSTTKGQLDGTIHLSVADTADFTAFDGSNSWMSFGGSRGGTVGSETPTNELAATLDELRFREGAVSDAEAAAQYTNQATPTTFYTVGSEQAA